MPLDPVAVAAAAQDLLGARAHRLQIRSLAARMPGFDAPAAYRVAGRLHAARLAAGDVPVGRKVGFTNRNIWDEYGVHAPIWGTMYASTVQRLAGPRGRCSLAGMVEPRIEPEIVFGFARAPAAGASLADVLDCVAWIAHGFEIVDSHFRGWKFAAPDTMADNGLHGALVVGPPLEPRALASGTDDLVARLASFSIVLERGGEVRDRGTGANVLGNPLEAVRHLLAVLRDLPGAAPLAAGEIVTTGTLTAALPVAPGDTWSTTISGLGLDGLTVRFD